MWACSGTRDLSVLSASTGRRTHVRERTVRCLLASAETDTEPGGGRTGARPAQQGRRRQARVVRQLRRGRHPWLTTPSPCEEAVKAAMEERGEVTPRAFEQ